MVSVFAGVGLVSEVPAGLVASTTCWPDTFAATFNVRLADAPDGVTELTVNVIAGGAESGSTENVALVRFAPVTMKSGTMVFASTAFCCSDVITGFGNTLISPTFVVPPTAGG